MGRAPCCEKVGLKKGRWTAEEDEKLLNYIAANGEGNWRSLPKNAGLLRCGKSCRLRWINYLRADLKRGNITKEEEQIIIKMHSTLGNRWSVIAGHLPGRTDNEIKNYWNSHLSRRLHRFRKLGSDEEIVTLVLDNTYTGKRRASRNSQLPATSTSKNPTDTVIEEKESSVTSAIRRQLPGGTETAGGQQGLNESGAQEEQAGEEVGPLNISRSTSSSLASSSPSSCERQQVEKLFDWDVEAQAHLWGEELWPWPWDGDVGINIVREETTTRDGHHEEVGLFDSWLLSDTL